MNHKLCNILFFLLVVTAIFAVPFDLVMTDSSDFAGGIHRNIEIIADPTYPNAALVLSEFDTIKVLQVYPDGHCIDCIYRIVDSLAPLGSPPLHFKIEVTTITRFNSIASLDATFQAANPATGALISRTLRPYDIIYFGIANGYGGRANDLSTSGTARVREFARLGKGIVLTHDTIAKRRGWTVTTPLCTDTRNFEHPNFNAITDVTGLTADWVSCYAPDPDSHYFQVYRNPLAPTGANILNAPFILPDSFTITACHEFGERLSTGTVWYQGPHGQLYMHSYHSLAYGSYASYFSTGHEEEYYGSGFRPSPWEGKAMINAMYYAYFGGRGSGVFESRMFSAPCPGTLTGMSCVVEFPGVSVITIELSASADGSTWTDWFVIIPGFPIPTPLVNGPYYRYRVSMTRGIHGERPILRSITWHFDLPYPELTLLIPPVSSFYSCSCGAVRWRVRSRNGLDLSTISILMNSVRYGPSRCGWSPTDSILEFLGPIGCWVHGVTYIGLIEALESGTGCPRIGDTTFLFTADLRPPIISNTYPPNDTIVANPSITIRATIIDNTSDEKDSTFYWIINGDSIGWGMPGLSWNNAINELRFNPSFAGRRFGDTVRVCVGAGDIAIGCGPNMADSCWRFIVDTLPPTIEMFSPPTGFLSCDSLRAGFIISDIAGISPTSIRIKCRSSIFTYPTGMVFRSDSLFFSPPLPVSDGETLLVIFESYSDMLGNSGRPDTFQIIVDLSPPVVWGISPVVGGYTGTASPNLTLSLADSISGLVASSIEVIVEGVPYNISHGTWDGVRLVLNGSSLGWAFAHNESISVCVRARDNSSGCGPNMLDSCWFFRVNLRGPECELIGPLDGWWVGCDTFHIIFSLHDPNGVNFSTLSFSVNGTLYNASSPNVRIRGDTVDFVPTSPWRDGDIVRFITLRGDDSLGNPLEVPCTASFRVDLFPPRIIPLFPPHNGVVDTTRPVISALIRDRSGIAPSSIVFCAGGDCWGYDSLPACLRWTGDTLFFNPNAIGYSLDEETVFVRIEACDITQWCGPNCGDTVWMFLIDNRGPRAFLVEPISGTFSSCEFQRFLVRVVDPSGLLMDSLLISVNGVPIRWGDPRLAYIGDTLIFSPNVPWNHFDTVDFALLSAYDSVFNPLQDTIFTRVFIDLEPPEITILRPLPGATDIRPQDTVVVVITDEGCGINWLALGFYANGQRFSFSSGLVLIGDTLKFFPVSAGFHFNERGNDSVRIIVRDCAGYCPPNALDSTWRFYVPDDDSIGPEWIDYTPALWLEDSVFTVYCRARDISGIYLGTRPNPQAPFLRWDNDGEIITDCNTAWLEMFAMNGDTVTFRTITPLISRDADSNIIMSATCWDNDYDFLLPSDRSQSDSPLWFVEIVARANVSMTLPRPGWITSCRDQRIRFSVSGEVALDMASCVFEIDRDTFDLLSPELALEGDSVFVFTPPGEIFNDGIIIARLISANDEYGNPLYVPIEWRFAVDTEPPIFWLIKPTDGAMVPENDFGFVVGISDNVCGIDESTIDMTVFIHSDSFEYHVGDVGVIWNPAARRFSFDPVLAGLPAEDGDTLIVRICAGDDPDLCQSNIGCFMFEFWIEPHVECSTSTDPFTPNADGFNDVVIFYWPHFYRDGAEISIYDMRGATIRKFDALPGNFKSAEWDGLDDNGRKCPAGVYVYVVRVNGKRICHGSVTLVR